MSDNKKKMLKWLDANGDPMVTPGTLTIAESTGETFDVHSADTTKHLTSAQKTMLTAVDAAGGVVLLDVNGLVPISKLPKDVKESRVVEDIAARDALDTYESLLAWVKDASADPAVGAGAAQYIYDGTGWTLTAKANQMVVVNKWSEIEGKPSSAVEDIDDAVAKRHTHSNLTSLNRLSVDADGLQVDGVGVGGIAIVSSAADTPIYNGKLRLLITEYTPPTV